MKGHSSRSTLRKMRGAKTPCAFEANTSSAGKLNMSGPALANETESPKDQPINEIRQIVDTALQGIVLWFDDFYATNASPANPPEVLIRGSMPQRLFTVISDRAITVVHYTAWIQIHQSSLCRTLSAMSDPNRRSPGTAPAGRG